MESLGATGLSISTGLGISCLLQFRQAKKCVKLWGWVTYSFHFDTAEWLKDVFCILTMNSMQQPYVKCKEYNCYSEAVIL